MRVLLFGPLAELAEPVLPDLELADGARAADLLAHLGARVPALAGRLESVAIAVNLAYVRPDHRLEGGDEVALIPPVSGG